MAYIKSRDLDRCLVFLRRKGGAFEKASRKVDQLFGAISRGAKDPFEGWRVTKNNESRIPKCVKYELPGRARLVTVQEDNACILLYAGDHEDVDAWLNSNRGKVFKVDKNNIIKEIPSLDPAQELPKKTSEGDLRKPLYSYLEKSLYKRLVDGLKKVEIKALEALNAGDYADLADIVTDLDCNLQARAVNAAFNSLMGDDVSEANDIVRDYIGELKSINQTSDFISSDKFHIIPRSDPGYAQRVSRLLDAPDYRPWMLFMHPQQELVATEILDGPAKLTGVSGSGKTCVVVRRALELAARYPEGQVLVLTLNPPLASLIRELVNTAGDDSVLGRIRVAPLFSLCQTLLSQFEPDNDRHYDEVTWKAGEHVDEVWREYYRCEVGNDDAACMRPVHDSLISRGIDAERYLREEFDWIRSAFPPDRRGEYLTGERKGRTYPLPRHFREKVLEGLDGWERKLKMVGVTDYLGIATATFQHLEEITPAYRCAIVDESQDFGTTELSIVRRLVQTGMDDLFLCGDAAQRVSSKFQSLQAAGINTHSKRSRELVLNYRNSRDILEAAFEVLDSNLQMGNIEDSDFDVLDPEFADFSGPTPLILEAGSLAEEVANAVAYTETLKIPGISNKTLIAIAGFTNFEIMRFGERVDVGLPVLQPDSGLTDSEIHLSDLEQSKGFEFDNVFILNVCDGTLPDQRTPDDEQYRDLARFYVTMTRAKKNLIISWSDSLSPYMSGVGEHFLAGRWADFLEVMPVPWPVPSRLDSIRSRQDDQRPLQLQDASEFLYRAVAIGMRSQVIEQLRKYVTGNSRVEGSRRMRIEWKDMGTLFRDLRQDPAARRRFGKESSEYLLEYLGRVLKQS